MAEAGKVNNDGGTRVKEARQHGVIAGVGDIRWLAKEHEGQEWGGNTESLMPLPHKYFLLEHAQLGVVKDKQRPEEKAKQGGKRNEGQGA